MSRSFTIGDIPYTVGGGNGFLPGASTKFGCAIMGLAIPMASDKVPAATASFNCFSKTLSFSQSFLIRLINQFCFLVEYR